MPIDAATVLTAKFGPGCVDQQQSEVGIFRVASPVFDYTLPDENSIYEYLGAVGPQFEGTIDPAVGDGYWSYIPPPAPGQYTLRFTSANSSGFELDVTYCLTVE